MGDRHSGGGTQQEEARFRAVDERLAALERATMCSSRAFTPQAISSEGYARTENVVSHRGHAEALDVPALERDELLLRILQCVGTAE